MKEQNKNEYTKSASSEAHAPKNTSQTSDRARRIQYLNDQLRIHGKGGMIVCTRGILDLDTHIIASIGDTVRRFDDFNEDNDPYGEHDCAMVRVGSSIIMFKIDPYDLTCSHHSPEATDPSVTKRVMTIMLCEEY